jgi:hypothetical protein
MNTATVRCDQCRKRIARVKGDPAGEVSITSRSGAFKRQIITVDKAGVVVHCSVHGPKRVRLDAMRDALRSGFTTVLPE